MFISRIELNGFRNFQKGNVEFNPGLNILIGENNSGKTNLFKALDLVFGKTHRRLSIDDFNKGQTDFKKPPEVSITVILQGEETDSPDVKATVAPWLIKIEKPWHACLTYQFYLPEKSLPEYEKRIEKIGVADADKSEFWSVVERMLSKYVARIYGGNPISRNRADAERLERFDCHFLDAIRDVESKLFSGKNPLLREVLEYFLDHDIKRAIDLEDESKLEEIEKRKKSFRKLSEPVITTLIDRIQKDHIQRFAEKTGASKCGKPDFAGVLAEREAIEALKLVIEDMGFSIPITSNGLGYNNLIYIAFLLAKIDIESSGDHAGDNSTVFPLLLLEEPEAHLHPALQYKFVQFLHREITHNANKKQIFISSHSTHVTSAVSLESIVVLSKNTKGEFVTAYPGRVFSQSKKDLASKQYVERYLDATKSNMLFSKGVIFIEGISELLLVPSLARLVQAPLEDNHVAIINVEGSCFKHFLKIFGWNLDGQRQKFALQVRVACILDSDPKKKNRLGTGNKWQACWPFEVQTENDIYEYQPISSVISNLNRASPGNVKICYDPSGKAKTLEYDLMFKNPTCSFLVTPAIGKNYKVVKSFIDLYPREYAMLTHPKEDPHICSILGRCQWQEEEKKSAKIAAHALPVRRKGEIASAVQRALENKMATESFESISFNVPEHIHKAILWASKGAV